MNWKEDYKSKLTSFAGAAKAIKSGDFVTTGMGTGAVSPLMYEAIIDRHEELKDVLFFDVLQLQKTRLYDPEFMKQLEGQITHVAGFGMATIRKAYQANTTDPYISGTADAGIRLEKRTDVLMIMCTPPNRNGWVNLGLCNDHIGDILALWRKAGIKRTIVAEINDQMPVVYGDNWMPLSEIDIIVEHSSKIPTFTRGEPSQAEKTIGNYVLELINNGDTIQMGIGGITEAVVAGLEGKHDLGVVTEMFPSGLPQLVKKGIVTNMHKPLHPGVSIATFCIGDQEMYDFVAENPMCEVYPGSYSNNIPFIAQHPNLVAMNTGLLVDFSGQIASEGIGHRQVSGCGGQFEFMLGAWLSPGGRGITLLNSASKDKDGNLVSSIVPALPEGTPVTVTRAYANYVVTEYGIAQLKDKSRRERALELISIAHPDLRGELRKSLRTNFYYPDFNFGD